MHVLLRGTCARTVDVMIPGLACLTTGGRAHMVRAPPAMRMRHLPTGSDVESSAAAEQPRFCTDKTHALVDQCVNSLEAELHSILKFGLACWG